MSKQRIIVCLIFFSVLLFSVFVSGKVYTHYQDTIGYPRESIFFNFNNTCYCHFSIDDSISIFEDLTNNENIYDSIFDSPNLGFVKELHDQYDIKISFYVYYSWNMTNSSFDLSKATGKFLEEFNCNSDWLRFGFHAKDAVAYETLTASTEEEFFKLTVQELKRIVGEDSIDYFLRLDRYVADIDTVKALKNNGVKGLLAAPSPERKSYSLSSEETKQCYQNDWIIDKYEMAYTPTDVQIENINNDEEFYETIQNMVEQPRVELFTHEWILNDLNVKKYMTWYAYVFNKNQVRFSFSEN